MKTEPALIIGFIGAAVLAVIQTFAGSGIVSADTGQTILNIATTLIPLIVGIITRAFVTSPATVAKIRAGQA
jgi:hypothetical protein